MLGRAGAGAPDVERADEARGATQHPGRHRTGPTAKSDPARKARMAEVERIWLKEALFLNEIE